MSEEMTPEEMGKIHTSEKMKEDLKDVDEEIEVTMLSVGGAIEVETNNTKYKIEKREDGMYISGNPKYCPEPTKAEIGSLSKIADADNIKPNVIKKGWRLLYTINDKDTIYAGDIQGFDLLPRQ